MTTILQEEDISSAPSPSEVALLALAAVVTENTSDARQWPTDSQGQTAYAQHIFEQWLEKPTTKAAVSAINSLPVISECLQLAEEVSGCVIANAPTVVAYDHPGWEGAAFAYPAQGLLTLPTKSVRALIAGEGIHLEAGGIYYHSARYELLHELLHFTQPDEEYDYGQRDHTLPADTLIMEGAVEYLTCQAFDGFFGRDWCGNAHAQTVAALLRYTRDPLETAKACSRSHKNVRLVLLAAAVGLTEVELRAALEPTADSAQPAGLAPLLASLDVSARKCARRGSTTKDSVRSRLFTRKVMGARQ